MASLSLMATSCRILSFLSFTAVR